jgi:hypothetical protein
MLLLPCYRWNLLVTDNLPITLLWLALYVLMKMCDSKAAHLYKTTGKSMIFIRGNFDLPVFRQKRKRQNIVQWTVEIITGKCVYTVKFVFPTARSNLVANREHWITVYIQTKSPLLWIQIFICTKFLLPRRSPPCRGGGGLAVLNDLTGYAGGNFMFLVVRPKPDRP